MKSVSNIPVNATVNARNDQRPLNGRLNCVRSVGLGSACKRRLSLWPMPYASLACDMTSASEVAVAASGALQVLYAFAFAFCLLHLHSLADAFWSQCVPVGQNSGKFPLKRVHLCQKLHMDTSS